MQNVGYVSVRSDRRGVLSLPKPETLLLSGGKTLAICQCGLTEGEFQVKPETPLLSGGKMLAICQCGLTEGEFQVYLNLKLTCCLVAKRWLFVSAV